MRNLIFISTMILASCAFKAPTDPTSGGTSVPPGTMQISFEDKGKTVSINRVLGSEAAVTLPTEIPKQIRVAGLSSDSHAYLAKGDILTPIESDYDGSDVRIFGIDALFAFGNPPQVKISFSDDGGNTADSSLVLKTPPTPATLAAFDHAKITDLQPKLLNRSSRLDLLYTFSISNLTTEAVEYHLPVTIKGELQQTETDYIVNQHDCSTDTSVNSSMSHFATKFFLLPISKKILDSWESSVTNAENVFTLNPGEETIYALYGQGTDLANFVDNGVRTSSHTNISVVNQCSTYEPACNALVEFKFPGTKTMRPGCPPPQFGKNYRTEPVGTDLSPVNWSLDSSSNMMELRNTLYNQSDDPEARTQAIFNQTQQIL